MLNYPAAKCNGISPKYVDSEEEKRFDVYCRDHIAYCISIDLLTAHKILWVECNQWKAIHVISCLRHTLATAQICAREHTHMGVPPETIYVRVTWIGNTYIDYGCMQNTHAHTYTFTCSYFRIWLNEIDSLLRRFQWHPNPISVEPLTGSGHLECNNCANYLEQIGTSLRIVIAHHYGKQA